MTMPPPPPDRMHLQYQPPPQQPGPQQMGPGGAYGQMQSPAQPIPGQMPAPGLSMRKPGTITGIQVILWIFLAISAVSNLLSVMSMFEYFTPFSLIGLAYAVYSTIQSLASGVHISRGKRWAWIWSLISAILGLALTGTGIVYGTIFWDTGGDVMLLITCPLAALYVTLLGLLCSKSARQWILMHRIQRGEVQAPGMGMGAMPGAAPMGGMAQQGPAQRPDTKPGAVTFATVVLGLLMALAAWQLFAFARFMIRLNSDPEFAAFYDLGMGFRALGPTYLAAAASGLVLVFGLISALGLHKGRTGARVFTIVWTPILFLGIGFLVALAFREYLVYRDFIYPPERTAALIDQIRDISVVGLIIVAFIAVLTPGVRAWTPGKPSTALIMMVPMGQPQAPQQPGPYGQPQGGYPQQQPQQGYQQQPPYPPQY